MRVSIDSAQGSNPLESVHGQEGAVAVTVAVTILALIGTAMLAIDGGALWASRRNLVTDTDAAALAAVRVLVHGDCSASDEADAQDAASEVLTANDAASVLLSPATVLCTPDAGRVAVSAQRTTQLAFGGLAGLSDVDVASTSLAQYGQVASGSGLRPIGICNKDPHFLAISRDGGHIDDQGIIDLLGGQDGQDLLDLVNAVEADSGEHPTNGPEGAYPAGSVVHRVYFSRVSVSIGCGDAAGNWGWLDFDGGGGGKAQVSDWLLNGYDQPITVGVGEDCAPEVSGEPNCIGEPGAGGNSWNTTLEQLRCPSNLDLDACASQQLAYPIIVYSGAVCTGNPNNCNGANTRYDADAFVGVIIRDWDKVTGNPNDLSYFDLEFVDPFITNGTIVGTPPGTGPGLIAIQLCGGGVDTVTDNFCLVP